MTFRMKIDRETLQGLANFLKQTTDEINIEIKDGITIAYNCLGGYSGAQIHIPKTAIKELQGQTELGLDTTQFYTIVSTFKDDELELTVEGDAMLYIRSKTQENYTRLILPDSQKTEEFIPIKKEMPAKFTIDANELLGILKIADIHFGTQIYFEFNGDKKQLAIISQKITTGFKKQLSVKKGKGSAGKARFQLSFIQDMTTGANGDIQIEIGNEMPIKIMFDVGHMQVQSFIAPRIDDETQQGGLDEN